MKPSHDIGPAKPSRDRQVTVERDKSGTVVGLHVAHEGYMGRLIEVNELQLRVDGLRNIATLHEGLKLKSEGNIETWAVGAPDRRITVRVPNLDAIRAINSPSAGTIFLKVLEAAERSVANWLSSLPAELNPPVVAADLATPPNFLIEDERQTQGDLAVIDMIRGAGQSEREVIELLIRWAMAYDDIGGMDEADADLYMRLIAIRDNPDQEV